MLTLKEIEHLLNGILEQPYQPFILIRLSIALRLGEVLALTIHYIEKNRRIVLPKMALDAMRRYWAAHPFLIFPRGLTIKARSLATKLKVSRRFTEVA